MESVVERIVGRRRRRDRRIECTDCLPAGWLGRHRRSHAGRRREHASSACTSTKTRIRPSAVICWGGWVRRARIGDTVDHRGATTPRRTARRPCGWPGSGSRSRAKRAAADSTGKEARGYTVLVLMHRHGDGRCTYARGPGDGANTAARRWRLTLGFVAIEGVCAAGLGRAWRCSPTRGITWRMPQRSASVGMPLAVSTKRSHHGMTFGYHRGGSVGRDGQRRFARRDRVGDRVGGDRSNPSPPPQPMDR